MADQKKLAKKISVTNKAPAPITDGTITAAVHRIYARERERHPNASCLTEKDAAQTAKEYIALVQAIRERELRQAVRRMFATYRSERGETPQARDEAADKFADKLLATMRSENISLADVTSL